MYFVLVARVTKEAVSSNAMGDAAVKLTNVSSTKQPDLSNIVKLVIKSINQGTRTGLKWKVKLGA